MNFNKVIENYIIKTLKTINGMKCLILDNETLSTITMCIGMKELYNEDIYLIQQIQESHKKLNENTFLYCCRRISQVVNPLIVYNDCYNLFHHFLQY